MIFMKYLKKLIDFNRILTDIDFITQKLILYLFFKLNYIV